MINLSLSALPHTWIIDIDGTILKHNGHKELGDKLLAGVKEFLQRIPAEDTIILMSAREECYAEATLSFLRSNNLRYDQVIFGLPKGERILINDVKPSGLDTALAINVARDEGLDNLVLTYDR